MWAFSYQNSIKYDKIKGQRVHRYLCLISGWWPCPLLGGPWSNLHKHCTCSYSSQELSVLGLAVRRLVCNVEIPSSNPALAVCNRANSSTSHHDFLSAFPLWTELTLTLSIVRLSERCLSWTEICYDGRKVSCNLPSSGIFCSPSVILVGIQLRTKKCATFYFHFIFAKFLTF